MARPEAGTETETSLVTTRAEVVEIAHDLVESASAYAAAAISESTKKAYRSAWKRFTTFCEQLGAQPLPASQELVAVYISHRADSGRKVSTICSDLAAIKAAHKAAGHPAPTDSAKVKTVLAGIKREVGTAPAQKKALGINDIRRMVDTLELETLRGARDHLVVVLGFAGAFRRSELVALAVEDIQEVEHGLRITLRRSKTDQVGAGRVVPVPYGSNPSTCPVRCYRRWLEASGVDTGPVLRTIDHGDHLRKQRMSSRAVARLVKKLAKRIGVDPKLVSGHSLRAGFCTEAARNSASARQIMAITGHRSSAMVDRYVREVDMWRDNAASMVGL